MLTENPCCWLDKNFPDRRAWVLAYSGGVDSHVLLHLLCRYRDENAAFTPTIKAVHINHQIHPQAMQWQSHCEDICRDLEVEFLTESVTLEQTSRRGLGRLAREARYEAFKSFVRHDELLLQAHHLDDQAETVLLRLLRGAGPEGLSGIPESRSIGDATLVRPLLNYSREQILEYAEQAGLEWIEDPGNQPLKHDRNFLRHRVLPVLRERWPDVAAKLTASAALVRANVSISQDVAREDIKSAAGVDRFNQRFIDIDALQILNAERLRNALRLWLRDSGYLAPARKQLDSLIADVLHAREDSIPRWQVGTLVLRRYANRLYQVKEGLQEPTHDRYALTTESALAIEGGVRVRLSEEPGKGVKPGTQAEIRFGCRDQRCRLLGASVSRSLKRQFQELRIPPWLRDYAPLLFVDGDLAAIADIAVIAGHEVREAEVGWQLDWELPR